MTLRTVYVMHRRQWNSHNETVIQTCARLRRAFCSMTSGETLLEALQNHEASGVPTDAGTDSSAGFDLVKIPFITNTCQRVT